MTKLSDMTKSGTNPDRRSDHFMRYRIRVHAATSTSTVSPASPLGVLLRPSRPSRFYSVLTYPRSWCSAWRVPLTPKITHTNLRRP
jgi:hypothetical protein